MRLVTTYVFWCYVCFCNFRLLVLYAITVKSASIIIKITTFVVRLIESYTLNMSIFTKATTAKPAKMHNAQNIIYVYTFVLIIFVVCQLFTYDDFVRLIESFWLPGGLPVAHFLSCLIVIGELFAIPFLLRMSLSQLMRIISMVLGWFVPIIWLFLTLWVNLTINSISNIGFIGTLVNLTPGWWAVYISFAMCLLAIWSSWGLWPLGISKETKHK